MNQYLVTQLELHESIQPVDVIKMTYQSVFGADHLLTDTDRAYRYFCQEYEKTVPENILLLEVISDTYARANIAGWKYHNRERDELFEQFRKAAGKSEGSEEKFIAQLQENSETLQKLFATEKYEQFNSYFQLYLSEGIRAVSHSRLYHETENPAYRIVLREHFQ